jgi:shikimate dehydrogenase
VTLRITASTALCGVILHPVGHTRSPAMHNAAFAELGLDAVYLAFDVLPETLGAAVSGARALGLRQLAVSLPHKVAVIRHLDDLDETARRIGAVNTVTCHEGRLVGSNTDWLGAVRALERVTPLEGRRAVVIGAGGAARAIVFGLLARGARVTVLNRTEGRARELADALGAHDAGPLERLASLDHDVLVNSTSVGMGGDVSPVPAGSLRAGSVVMDAVYAPPLTRLLRDAASRDARTVGGKWMLVYQAAEQLELWSGRRAPVDVMAAAFDSA